MKFVLPAALAAMVAVATMSAAPAATFNSVGILAPASPTGGLGATTNNFNVNLFVANALASARTSELSGTLGVDFEVTGTEITGLNLNGGTVAFTDWTWNLGFLGNFEVTGISAFGDGQGVVAVPASGDFDSSSTQQLLINTGTALGVGGAIDGVSFDFSVPGDELPVPGDDVLLANLTQSAAGTIISWTLSIPVDQAVDVADDFGGVDLVAQGNLVASGSFDASPPNVIPEPTSGLFLATLAAGAGAVVRRRRK